MAQEQNLITVKFKPTGHKALTRAINELARAQARLEKGTVRIGDSTKKYSNKLQLLGGQLSVIRSKLLVLSFALSLGTKQMLAMVKQSAKVDALRLSFANLTKAAELNVGTLQMLRDATNGTTSDMTLLTQANNAMILGIVRSSDEMAEMFDVAQRLGRAVGRDTASSVESLITGIGRQSRLMLDNIGIIVKSEQAYQKLADNLGITTEELTDAQKKQAFLNATMEAAREKVAMLGAETLTSQDKFNKFSAAIDNAQDVIGSKLSPTLSKAANFYADLIDSLFGAREETIKYSDEIIASEKELNKLQNMSKIYQHVLDNYQHSAKDVIRVIMMTNEELVTEEQARDKVRKQQEITQKQIEMLIAFIKAEKEAYKENRGEKEKGNIVEELTREQKKKLLIENQNLLLAIKEEKALKDSIITVDEQRNLIDERKIQLDELKAQGFIAESEHLKQMNMLKKQSISLDEQELKKSVEKVQSYGKIVGGLANLNSAMKGSMLVTARLQQIQAMVDAYAGAQSGWAQNKKAYPFPIPELLYGADIAAGLAQARAVESQIGKFETGGYVGGRRHSEGGTLIEAERGEFVMSRNAVESVGLEAMNRINQTGNAGGVTVNVSGNVMTQDFVENDLADAIREAARRGVAFS